MIWSSDHLFICQWCWYESHHLLLRWFFSVIFHVRLFYIETSLRLHNSPPHLFCSQFLTIPILALWTFYIHLMNRAKCRDEPIVNVWSLDILTLLNSILGSVSFNVSLTNDFQMCDSYLWQFENISTHCYCNI